MKQIKQLDLFGKSDLSTSEMGNKKVDSSPWVMFIDGASRNNPGPSAVGMHILKDDTPISSKGFYTGIKTNNQAEYLALIVGVMLLRELTQPFDRIEIYADSQLLVRQMEGAYKIKNEALKQYASCAKQLLEPYGHTLHHVLREKNSIADALANKGLDQKISPPDSIIEQLKDYDILL
ncbi:MAG TPA: ribonuclease HI family protein [Candidatus Babeliales bacterium]|nr:ribonuclease HI family protein [Candidatus Babeliales bacterium]